jgi:hypothetical protein
VNYRTGRGAGAAGGDMGELGGIGKGMMSLDGVLKVGADQEALPQRSVVLELRQSHPTLAPHPRSRVVMRDGAEVEGRRPVSASRGLIHRRGSRDEVTTHRVKYWSRDDQGPEAMDLPYHGGIRRMR